ncbi:hypothetical protein M9435_001543 [Picochlorum sp. BPE23]|nr:hypothetical protein M9435_001543 [Picochlorum sp. BPE23]
MPASHSHTRLSHEKAILLAVSGIAGAIAAVRSRGHRMHAASVMEHTLSDVAVSQHEIPHEAESKKYRGKSVLFSFVGIVLHASISCALIWRMTDASVAANNNALALGFASIALLILHAWLISSHQKWKRGKVQEEVVASSAPSTRHMDRGHANTAVQQHLPAYMKSCNGRWIKDREASDSMDPVCDIMGIGGIMKAAIRLIVGSDVTFLDNAQSPASFQFAAFSVIRWFKIRERYPLFNTSLSLVHHRRRDFRPGGMQGRIHVQHDAQTNRPTVLIDNAFYGHRAGTMKEVFTWPREDVMHVDTVITNDHGSASFLQIFHRKKT